MSWLSSEELRECDPVPATVPASAGRRGGTGPVSCTADDADVVAVTTAVLSPLLVVNDVAWS